jgi:lipopolysaccharide biosynthesis glycosyltransferase
MREPRLELRFLCYPCHSSGLFRQSARRDRITYLAASLASSSMELPMTQFRQVQFPDSSLGSPGLIRSPNLEVLCGCDERYLPHAATMLCSLLEHNSVFRIHIFYSSIDGCQLAKLKSLVERYGSEAVCYEMVREDFQDLRVDKGASQSSIANYFRLWAPRILPRNLERILYLDSDIIVRRSLTDLWNTDLCDHALAAVEDSFWDPKAGYGYVELTPGAKYFNSGVLLINLDYWKQNSVYERAVEFMRNNPDKLNYYDQDALNAILVHRWINLPAIWNEHALSTPGPPALRNKHIVNPAIVHFVGDDKPWRWSSKHPFKREYHKYRRKTPWRQYREEGRPALPQRLGRSLRRSARVVLPGRLREWLRSRVMSSQA